MVRTWEPDSAFGTQNPDPQGLFRYRRVGAVAAETVCGALSQVVRPLEEGGVVAEVLYSKTVPEVAIVDNFVVQGGGAGFVPVLGVHVRGSAAHQVAVEIFDWDTGDFGARSMPGSLESPVLEG